ncbi:MAG: hypothetical protein ACLRSD_00990 [Oscillibacter sp.]
MRSITAFSIHDNALVAAATLSDRYITDRFLPDKAIDLVDEACAMIRTEIDSMPAELDDARPQDHAAGDRGAGAQERGRRRSPATRLAGAPERACR